MLLTGCLFEARGAGYLTVVDLRGAEFLDVVWLQGSARGTRSDAHGSRRVGDGVQWTDQEMVRER